MISTIYTIVEKSNGKKLNGYVDLDSIKLSSNDRPCVYNLRKVESVLTKEVSYLVESWVDCIGGWVEEKDFNTIYNILKNNNFS